MESGKRGDERRDTQEGGAMRNRKRFRNIGQYIAIEKAHTSGNHYGRGREPGVHGKGSESFIPLSPQGPLKNM